MTKRTYNNLTDALRDLVNEDPMSFKKLGDATDVKRQGLMKFAAGKQGLQLWAADRLMRHYGLTVNVPAKRREK